MFTVVLTGGIACGKSAVSHLFANLGVPVIDADLISRELVLPGAAALAEIVAEFGDEILTENGNLDRSRMRQLVFHSEQKRSRLEQILHPRIHAEIQRQLNKLQADYCILVIPLLVESSQPYPADRILVIDCPVELQRARLAKRDQIDNQLIDDMLASQASREQRLAIADDIIENTQGFDHLEQQVLQLHRQYLAYSGSRHH
ncbi:MAG: dephospho-CoA kinase [Chromatiales bacterium]|jgi:dephospho-CoA kinase